MKCLYLGILALCAMPLCSISTPISKANDPNSIDWDEEACDVILGGGLGGLVAGTATGMVMCAPVLFVNPLAYSACHYLIGVGSLAGAGLGMGAVVMKKKSEFNEYKKHMAENKNEQMKKQ